MLKLLKVPGFLQNFSTYRFSKFCGNPGLNTMLKKSLNQMVNAYSEILSLL